MNYEVANEVPYVDPHSRGTGSIVTERKGYVLRTRGEHNRLVRHDYCCPIHGVFERQVPSGEVPDVVSCSSDLLHQTGLCGFPSPYQVPSVAQGWPAGKCKT